MESANEHQGRILLVDDESAILRTFRYCLEDEGYSVATANSAAQADALLRLGCRQQQAYLHARPMPAEAYANRLAAAMGVTAR